MGKVLKNHKGEGYIDVSVKILIAVVLGALILAGLYLLFQSVIFPNMNHQMEQMMNTGTERQLRQNNGRLEYSYDGENWKGSECSGVADGSTVKYLVSVVNGDSTVWLMSCTSSEGARLYTSTDGSNWTPGYSDRSSVYLGQNGTGARIVCGDGRAYHTSDGINWTMTSTKRY